MYTPMVSELPKPRDVQEDARYEDVHSLFKPQRAQKGKPRYTTTPRRDTDDLAALNAWARTVAAEAVPGVDWTPRDTWTALDRVLTDGEDTDRALFAARVFLGYVDEPNDSDIVPGTSLPWSAVRAELPKTLVGKQWSASIGIRRFYAARAFNGSTESHFQSPKPAFIKVAHGLLARLEQQVGLMVRERTDNESAPHAEPTVETHGRAEAGGSRALPGENATTPPEQQVIASPEESVRVRRKPDLTTSRSHGASRTNARLGRWLVAVGLVLVLVTVVLGVRLAQHSEVAAPTTVHTYVVPAAVVELTYASSDLDHEVACASRSYASARTDARSCVGVGADQRMFDPCFLTGEQVVVCMAGRLDAEGQPSEAIAARVVDTVKAEWLSDLTGMVGLEQADQTEFPWLFELDLRDADGTPYVCSAALMKKQAYADTAFDCFAGEGTGALYVASKEALMSGKGIIAVTSVVTASRFDRSTDLWTVRVAIPGTSELTVVPIVDAWF